MMNETDSIVFDKTYVNHLKDLLVFEKNNAVKNGLYDLTQTMMSYHSNKLEGSTLTYDDTWELYDKGMVFSSDAIRAQDITDAQGHFLMFDEMLDHIEEPISEEMICSWHRVLKSGSFTDKKKGFSIGSYKKLNNAIGGIIQTVGASDVPAEMKAFIERYHTIASVGHSIESLAKSHQSFEHIHPFQDGNGRVGRMLLFRQCLDAGIVPCIITESLSSDYKNALKDMTFGTDTDALSDVLTKASAGYAEKSSDYVRQYIKNS